MPRALLLVAAVTAMSGCSLIVEPTRVEDGAATSRDSAADLAPVADVRIADAPPDDRGPVDASVPGADGDGASCVPASSCDDGDPCTINDTCSSVGVCIGARAPDGTSCGRSDQARCCAGRCVNIANSESHCGGCGLACAPSFTCQGVGQTKSCSKTPRQTTGRCMCAGGKDALCPKGQSCRAATPYADHCSPKASNECASGQKVIWVTDCPNYCTY